jgi:hypothetical protein
MTVIRKTVTWGVTAPPKRNLILKFMKGGGRHKKWCKMCRSWRNEDSGTIGRRRTSQSLLQLFLPCVSVISPCRIRLCFTTLLIVRFITWSSWSSNSSRCSEWKWTFSNANIENDITHRGKKFQTESILGAIEDDILLDNRTGQIHEGTSEIMTTWLKCGPTPCRVLAQNQWYMSTNRAKWL